MKQEGIAFSGDTVFINNNSSSVSGWIIIIIHLD